MSRHFQRTQSVVADGVSIAEPSPSWSADWPSRASFQEFAERTGLPCLIVDRDRRKVVGQSPSTLRLLDADWVLDSVCALFRTEIVCITDHLTFFAFRWQADSRFVIVGYALSSRDSRPVELILAALDAGWNRTQLNERVGLLPVCDVTLLRRLLIIAGQNFHHSGRTVDLQSEWITMTEKKEDSFEQIQLLHRLTGNLHLAQPREQLAEMCLQWLQSLIESRGVVIFLKQGKTETHFMAQGRLAFDQSGLTRLVSHFDQHDWSRPLIKNRLHQTPLGQEFPGLKSLLVVAIGDPQNRCGWIVSTNLPGDREYGTAEANLISSIATIFGTPLLNTESFDEHDTPLVGFVSSLVSTLDAKDPYTRGHSERVALIARRIGEQLRLESADLEDLYLSGLLHDIGKVVLDHRILSKPGKLTAVELRQMELHPMIGYQILRKLKNLKSILPGVRSHHEFYNGNGYPDKLTGDEIPLMARILAVADSYDAMASDRPYRQALPWNQVQAIFRKGAKQQWDPRVIEAFFAVREDVQRLCESYSPATANRLAGNTPTYSNALSQKKRLRRPAVSEMDASV